MESYLAECKSKLAKADESQRFKIVLGNEACDLDSAVSSLVLAFFLSQKNTNKCHDVVLPVLNVLRKDIRLHSEVAFFLEETSINLDNLVCKDEINIKELANGGRLSVVLVDHNVLSSCDSFLLPFVELVIDHHVLENSQILQHAELIVEPVGSCCTLVAEHLFNAEPSLIDPQIAMLLFGTILLDTVCLEESAKRVTEKDKEIVEKLETLLEGISKQEVFQTLQRAKFDVTGFSPQQLLTKDLKVVTSNSFSVAISSIPVLLDDLTNGTSMEPALHDFAASGPYQSVILMGSHISKDGKSIRRHIAVFSPDQKFLNTLSDLLTSLKNPSLELESLTTTSKSLLLFDQKNTALTRKFVLPIVRKFLEQNMKSGKTSRADTLSDSSDVSSFVESGEGVDALAHNYRVETLDFPDSPDHGSLLQKLQQDIPEMNSGSAKCPQPKSFASLKSLEGGDTDSPGSARRKIFILPSDLREDSVNDDQKSLSSLSNKSELDIFSPTEDIILPEEEEDDDDDIDTPEELELSDGSAGLDLTTSEPIPEMSAAEEFEEERSWKMCVIGGEERRIDMKVIEPYKKVLSHGGYHGETRNAIIIFSACYLPDRSRKDYDYVMDNLFLYVLTTLDQLVAEDYILVYLHGATERGNMPSFGWLKRCYQMIDRRLRKNLKGLYLVHPTFWLKTIVIMTRPFISSKFSRKLKFVNDLEELSSLIPMDHVCIPDKVKTLDFELMMKRKKKQVKRRPCIPPPPPSHDISSVERY